MYTIQRETISSNIFCTYSQTIDPDPVFTEVKNAFTSATANPLDAATDLIVLLKSLTRATTCAASLTSKTY